MCGSRHAQADAAAASSSLQQAFFFASHGVLSDEDARLLRHYAVQLSSVAAAWVLLYRPEVDGAMEQLAAVHKASATIRPHNRRLPLFASCTLAID